MTKLNKKQTEEKAGKQQFFTGVKSVIDRKIGALNLLSNRQILLEKEKIKNMRNGKERL